MRWRARRSPWPWPAFPDARPRCGWLRCTGARSSRPRPGAARGRRGGVRSARRAARARPGGCGGGRRRSGDVPVRASAGCAGDRAAADDVSGSCRSARPHRRGAARGRAADHGRCKGRRPTWGRLVPCSDRPPRPRRSATGCPRRSRRRRRGGRRSLAICSASQARGRSPNATASRWPISSPVYTRTCGGGSPTPAGSAPPLAGPRATATVLTALPVLGILLGELVGAGPLQVLRSGVLGQALVVAGVGLAAAGAAWARAVLRSAVPR